MLCPCGTRDCGTFNAHQKEWMRTGSVASAAAAPLPMFDAEEFSKAYVVFDRFMDNPTHVRTPKGIAAIKDAPLRPRPALVHSGEPEPSTKPPPVLRVVRSEHE